jgi:hypothetical protein
MKNLLINLWAKGLNDVELQAVWETATAMPIGSVRAVEALGGWVLFTRGGTWRVREITVG